MKKFGWLRNSLKRIRLWFNRPRCRVCKQREKEFYRVHQFGVNNYLRTEGMHEPEILFDILICPDCGSIKADVDTIWITESSPVWDDPYGERLKEGKMYE